MDASVDARADTDLTKLWQEQGPQLWRAVFAYAGDREVASDAVAEAFAQCLRRGTQVRSPARWVWRVAFRLAAGELQRRGRHDPSLIEELSPAPDPAIDLVRALGRLPRKQRAALVLHYYGGYTTREAAEILGATAATVRVHLSQGRKRLRLMLEDDDD